MRRFYNWKQTFRETTVRIAVIHLLKHGQMSQLATSHAPSSIILGYSDLFTRPAELKLLAPTYHGISSDLFNKNNIYSGIAMVTIFDVAKYITERCGELSAMKLQKLMYYAQAWSLVWEEEPLFEDDFQAWANGPVLPALYARHLGQFKVNSELFIDGDSSHLSEAETKNIDKVLAFYGDKTAQWLSTLSHQETPWLDARGDLPSGSASENMIPKATIHEYYSSL